MPRQARNASVKYRTLPTPRPVSYTHLDVYKRQLIRRADSIGVRGINLLEFCFPLHKTEEFLRRGFKLRKHPYKYPYQYRYSGGIPVARSEKEALRLMEFAVAENLRMGVHYCSADNRISAQVNLQNKMFSHDGRLRRQWPWMDADEDDHFLRCAKAFGGGAADRCV